MPHSPYIEDTRPAPTGTFTGSIVITTQIDQYRQGVEAFSITDKRYTKAGIVTTRGGEQQSNFPEFKYPAVAHKDLTKDASEPWGDMSEGFLEPLTIRDEVTFSSIDSPFIAHRIAGDMFEQTIIEQSVLKNNQYKENIHTFFESGSIINTYVTSSVLQTQSGSRPTITSSIVSMDVIQDPNLNKISARAGWDVEQIIITGSMYAPTVRPIYKGTDSISFRNRAPYQGRQIFLNGDSMNINLSGTNIAFERGIDATSVETPVGRQFLPIVSGTTRYEINPAKKEYPPILRMNTEFSGKRATTFIDTEPSGIFSTFIRSGPNRTGISSVSNERPPQIYENNIPSRPRRSSGSAQPFKEIYNQGIAGSVNSGTGEWSNIILRFPLIEKSRRYVFVSANKEDFSATSQLREIQANTDGVRTRNKMLVYDFQGSSEHTGTNAGRSLTGSGWWEIGGLNISPMHLLLPGHYQEQVDSSGNNTAAISLITNNPKSLGAFSGNEMAEQATIRKVYLPERSFEFNFPFILTKVGIDAEILAANSAAAITTVGTDQPTSHQYINWNFQPLRGGSTLGTVLAFTNSFGLVIDPVRINQAPHATFMIIKTFGSREATRGIALHAGGSPLRDPISSKIYTSAGGNTGVPVMQILFTASIGMASSSVSADEQSGYPRFDYGFTNPELSGTANTPAFYVTRSISFVKDACVKYNITRSLGDEASLKRDLSPLSQDMNLINKGDRIFFIWPSNTLSFGANANIPNGQMMSNGWAPIFGVRDVIVSMQGYVPREGIAIPDSLNQNLTTNAIHEDIHEIIHDEFVGFVSSAWTGTILHRQSAPVNWKNQSIETLNFSLHGYKIFDSAERYLDTGITVLTGTGELQPGDKVFASRGVLATINDLSIIGDFPEYLRNHVRGKHPGMGSPVFANAAAISGSYSGFRYGVYNTASVNNSAIYKFNHYGHLRDTLEQRQYGRFLGVRKKDVLDQSEVVDTVAAIMSSSTDGLGQNPYLTSSAPFTDHRGIIPAGRSMLGAPYKS